MYKKRQIQKKIVEFSKTYPVLVVFGPRQAGKSTLVQNVFKGHTYVSLENLDTREFAETDPRKFLDQFEGSVILDEVQRVPSLLSYIQGIVDQRKKPNQFVLTGSAQLDLIQGVTQSLAGRSAMVQLLPFSYRELCEAKATSSTFEEHIFAGGYPRVHFDHAPVADWYSDYIQTYTERDVRLLIQVHELGTFQKFLKMCAARCGSILNLSGLANDCGISQTTAKNWINVLEATFVVFRLQPHFKNFSKRLMKTPKLYFFDTGVACSLLGIRNSNEITTHSQRGGLFENWVISEVYKNFTNQHISPPIYYWRDHKGIEIDLIIDHGEKVVPVEIKSGSTLNSDFFRDLKIYQSLAKKNVLDSCLIYGGEQNQERTNGRVFSWKTIPDFSSLS